MDYDIIYYSEESLNLVEFVNSNFSSYKNTR